MDQKSKMVLKEKRLLSKAEIDYINEKMAKRSVKVLVLIFLLLVSVSTALFIFLGGIKEGIVYFVLLHLFFVAIIVYTSKSTNKLLNIVNGDEVYVREAIYLDTNIHHHATFRVMSNGKTELYFRTVTPDSDVKAGDKVVLIEAGRQLWVYKAQSDKL